jgi:hypothetical protein
LGAVTVERRHRHQLEPQPQPANDPSPDRDRLNGYVGGDFTSVGGQTRHYIAAIDAARRGQHHLGSGRGNVVNAVLIDGSTMYVGGYFDSYIGGQSRTCLAALDLASGSATSWIPPAPNGGGVRSLTLDNGILYFAGDFTRSAAFPVLMWRPWTPRRRTDLLESAATDRGW